MSDALAAYLYLIRPPPGAKHRPVDPAKITLGGDSAGGGLVLALLCLIRDSGLPPPAGAMLISPWCGQSWSRPLPRYPFATHPELTSPCFADLTHSMPSILENTDTDIVPAYGFLFKPSTLWPPPSPEFQVRAQDSTSVEGLKKAAQDYQERSKSGSGSSDRHRHLLGNHSAAERKREELAARVVNATGGQDPKEAEGDHNNGATPTKDGEGQSKAEPAPIVKVKIDGVEVELKEQIQVYATNEQLAYPFVSPAWQPSLGGLPPLYVMCGEKEVLRDEIVYMAHRAAHPDRFPIRQAMLDFNPERTARTKDLPPTQVHLQIYDDVCHDLPLFSFLAQAKYCYRAMASFGKFVTSDSVVKQTAESLANGNSLQADSQAATPTTGVEARDQAVPVEDTDVTGCDEGPSASAAPPPLKRTRSLFDSLKRKPATPEEPMPSLSTSSSPAPFDEQKHKTIKGLDKTIYTALEPFRRPPFVDNMVRERVGIDGVVRPLEPIEDMPIFKLSPEDMGLIKEAPAKRYLAGSEWRRRGGWGSAAQADSHSLLASQRNYGTRSSTRQPRRLKSVASVSCSKFSSRPCCTALTPVILSLPPPDHLRKSMREEALRLDAHYQSQAKASGSTSSNPPLPAGEDAPKGRRTASPEPAVAGQEGIWRLHGERPPPSSIAARKDTREARQLARLMDEQFSKLSALNVFSEVHRVATSAGDAQRSESL